MTESETLVAGPGTTVRSVLWSVGAGLMLDVVAIS